MLKPKAPPRLGGCHRRPGQRGITLVESLVALTILALAVLGMLAVQLRTLVEAREGAARAQAVRLIDDLAERIKANPEGSMRIAAYLGGFDAPPALGARCDRRPCSAAELAAWDVAQWREAVAQSLPQGEAAVFATPEETQAGKATRRQVGVVVGWRVNERRRETDSDAQLLALRAAFAIDTGSAQIECPKDLICHVGYAQP